MEKIRTKISAVMFTDIVASSRISQRNQNLGIKVTEEHFKIVFKYLKQFDGNLVKDMGDGTLTYFDSAVDAVKCAICIMTEVIKINSDREEKWHLRIGIHIGEVFIKDNDIMGDTVNIASRIESSADPDSIFISSDVFKMVKRSIALSTVKIGPKELKNIEDKHILYKVLGEATKGFSKPKISKKRKKKIIFISALSIFVMLIILFYFLFPFQFVSVFKDINSNSFYFDYKTNQLKILNRNEKILWIKNLNNVVNKKKKLSDKIKITDLNNDGKNEVVIGHHTEDDTTKFASLSCYDFSGKRMWKTQFKKKIGRYSPYYNIPRILCEDLNNDDNQEIITVYNHSVYWPGFLTILNNEGKFLYQVQIALSSTTALFDVDKDGIKDIFVGGTQNVYSYNINSILIYLNGKRVFNNNENWRDKILYAPVTDSIQTVDGCFYPQKSLFALLFSGKHYGCYEGVTDIKFTEVSLQYTITNHKLNKIAGSSKAKAYSQYLFYDFKTIKTIYATGKQKDYFELIKKSPLVSDERIKKFYNDRYIYPQRLYYYNFDKMCLDTLFTTN